MPSLKLHNLFRRGTAAPTLQERAASLRAHISPRAAEPRTIAGNSPTEAPTPSEPAIEADAELLRLGRQFEAAHTRNIAACEACNAAQQEADRHMPKRPACLIYRASDAPLMVHRHLMMAEALAGQEVRYSDIEWLRHRMPMMHEVLRPIREGERAHRDHPGRKFDIVPHREAQARAEEIVAAWDAWWTKQTAVCGRYVTEALEAEAEEAGNAVASLAYQIAELPAHTAAGFRVKLRALSHLSRKSLLSEIPDEPDPDQALSHSLWRDVQGKDAASDDGHAAQLSTSSLVGTLDLASATMHELQALHDVAERIGAVAFAHAWGARCQRSKNKHGAPYFNAAGELVQWLGDALTAVETAVHKEARRRVPDSAFEREVRLQILAAPVTQNGDDDEVAAFARELLAHAIALREGR